MKKLSILTCIMLLAACSQDQQVVPEKYTIEQFYENLRISGRAFSDDENRLLVSSDETGIFNLFEIKISDGSKSQITNSAIESFFALDYVPGTGEILYSADKGGNEINHIYLLKSDGTSIDLTPGENEKASFVGWSDDKQFMYYNSNKRDPRFFDVYKMDIDSWTSEMIYQNNDGLNLNGISRDENIFALVRSITTSENKLFLYNRKTDEMIEISDPEYPGNYGASGFNMDNRYFYYVTNASNEFAYLVEYEIETKNRKVFFETNWDVMYSYLSENEKYRVIAINEDGKNRLIVKNNQTGKDINFPHIPDGNILAVNISDSENLMSLTVGSSKEPNNIYIYDLQQKELKKLTNTLNPEIDPEHLVAAEVVRYPSFDGLEIPSIFYKPHIASEKNPVPALVWVHGGPGGQSRIGYFALVQYLVNHGYAILAVNNRGSSGYGKTFYKMDDRNHGDKDLKDCIWGKKWLQEQNYIDENKIGIIGGSYGGYMTMAAMTFAPEEFQVGINIFGVTNWLRTLKSIPTYWESMRNALYTELGDPYSADSVRLYNISPLFHAKNIKNPIMVLQGANDPRVLKIESDEIVEAAKKNNIPVEYVILEDEGHGFIKKENEIEGYGKILLFLDMYLKKSNVD